MCLMLLLYINVAVLGKDETYLIFGIVCGNRGHELNLIPF